MQLTVLVLLAVLVVEHSTTAQCPPDLKLFGLNFTGSLLEQHLFSAYAVSRLNVSCAAGRICVNHRSVLWLHELVERLSSVWLDARLRDKLCSDRMSACVTGGSSEWPSGNLTSAAYSLLCRVSSEAATAQCVLTTLESVQYAFLHAVLSPDIALTIQHEHPAWSWPSVSSNSENGSISSSVYHDLWQRYRCLATHCSAEGMTRFAMAVYGMALSDQGGDNETECIFLTTPDNGGLVGPREEHIVVNFVRQVNLKSALVGLGLLLVLSVLAVGVTLHCTGRLAMIQAAGRQYIPLRGSGNARVREGGPLSGSALATGTTDDDLKAEESTHLLPGAGKST